MATIVFMRFNADQGAILSDESTWHLGFAYGYRRTRYGDSIVRITPEGKSDKGPLAVYAGLGFPEFHNEVAKRASKALSTDCPGNIPEISHKVLGEYQEVFKRYIDTKLRFHLCFSRDEMNQMSYTRNGTNYEITNEKTIAEAKALLNGQAKGDVMERIFDNTGFVFGLDPEMGITAYYVGQEGKSYDLSIPLGAVGPASQSATTYFSSIINSYNLDERRKGFEFYKGLLILLKTSAVTFSCTRMADGYVNLYIIDGKKTGKNRLNSVIDHRGRLIMEIAKACVWKLLDDNTAIKLLEELLDEKNSWESTEAKLFSAVKDPEKFSRYLLGFKVQYQEDSLSAVKKGAK